VAQQAPLFLSKSGHGTICSWTSKRPKLNSFVPGFHGMNEFSPFLHGICRVVRVFLVQTGLASILEKTLKM
jgi:hypothetical protein